MMRRYKISGVPVTKDRKLVGILTNRDLRFVSRTDLSIDSVMTKTNLITVPVGTTLEQAEDILHQHRVEKLLVVNDDYELKGLITVKDIQKKLKYPHASKDPQGRLRVAGAIGATGDFLERAAALVEMRVDALAIDSAHGHSSRVLEAVAEVKKAFPEVCLLAGNVATHDGALALDRCRCGCHQGGHRPGLNLHHAHGHRRGNAADHSYLRGSACRKQARHPGHRRRRHQVLRRRDQGDRGRGERRHDGIVVCRRGREPGRDHPLPGQILQGVSRNGQSERDGAGIGRTILPGAQRSRRMAPANART